MLNKFEVLDILKNNIDKNGWSKEKSDLFYNNLPRLTANRTDGNVIWSDDSIGIYFTKENHAHLLSYDGFIYKLSDIFYSIDGYLHDWEMHNIIYKECEKYNIRIDIPISCEVIEFKGKNMQYSIVQRPNNELGDDFGKDYLTGKLDTGYFIDYVDQTVILHECLKKVMAQTDGLRLLPEDGFHVLARNRDSIGYFWKDVKRCVSTYEKLVRTEYANLNMAIDIGKQNINDIDKDRILNYAAKMWAN